ncbi:MAG: Glu-tRNA(Gln) amidotransferase subunit GatE [Candidatus Micrarchaeota archaeon]|nr:Glu-tRNA(Gln) amidotransferase subunit GatE [Candidatus Micrarchaeota archaeon]
MKCGIEIHQRIAAGKLFCRCPSPSADEMGQKEVSFTRKLHAVRSELDEVDRAALFEEMRQRNIVYKAPTRYSCLVEADEEPPASINPHALHAALVFCHLFGSRIVDELHVMRKIVIDGSNTSGFQRTAVVGIGGSVSTSFGKVGIQTICIEEESAGIVQGNEFDLSRLGIPLVEISTEPVFESGKQAEEAALQIGTLLRKTGLVQRGIGTIRQDLNISVPGGARVEIKGVQELSLIATTIEIEVQRQSALIEISKEAKERLNDKQFQPIFVDLTDIFSQTGSQMISKAIGSGAKVFGMKLPMHAGLLGKQIAPGRRYGTELADYARLKGLRGLLHSDEDLLSYGVSEDELLEVKAALSVSQKDAFVLCFGDQQKVKDALFQVWKRATVFGVPEETRKANPDGTSSFMRPLPGKARMYPETDLPPIIISPEMLQQAKEALLKLEEAQKEIDSLISLLNPELAAQLRQQKDTISHNPSFEPKIPQPELAVFAFAVQNGVEPSFAASTITNTLQSLKREGVNTKELDEEKLASFFLAFKEGLFVKAAAADILRHMCNKKTTVKQAVEQLGLRKITGEQLANLVKKEGLGFAQLMQKYRLRVDAAELQKLFSNSK